MLYLPRCYDRIRDMLATGVTMNFSREEWFFFSGIVFTGVATTHNDIHHVRVTNSERRRILEIIGEEEEEEVPELEDVNF